MSKLSDVLSSFGFGEKVIGGVKIPAAEVQKSFLENLYFAGYFNLENVWAMLYLSEYKKDSSRILKRFGSDDLMGEAYLKLCNAIMMAKGHQSDFTQFRPEILLERLFEEEIFDEQDVQDMVLYLAQTAFGRTATQERSELPQNSWHAPCKDRYMANSRNLGLVSEITPQKERCDEAWVQGGARFRTVARMKSLKKYLDEKELEIAKVRILTGERELWVEIDKMPVSSGLSGDEKSAAEAESIEETKSFMCELAKENGIRFDGFETRMVDIGGGKKSPRTYLKYAKGETKLLTETMMAKKIYREVLGKDLETEEVIDSAAAAGASRPDTFKTAADAAKVALVNRVKESGGLEGIKVCVISNQPYVDRQVFSNQRGVCEVLRNAGLNDSKVSFVGFGDACEVDVKDVHSELGALVYEGYARATEATKGRRKCEASALLYSSRCSNYKLVTNSMAIVGAKISTTSAERLSAKPQQTLLSTQ